MPEWSVTNCLTVLSTGPGKPLDIFFKQDRHLPATPGVPPGTARHRSAIRAANAV